MPLFLSEEEFRFLSHDAAAVAERADAVIRDLRLQVDTAKAEKDAAAIAAEQTCALLDQRYESLSNDLALLRSENAQLAASVEQRLSEIAEIQAEKHQLHIKAIGKDGEIERLSLETVELHKSKRQLLELVEQKDAEIREKNATIQSYLDKIVSLTANASEKEARLNDSEAELARCRATCNRFTQEKELLEKHNDWLNEELSAKVNSLVELRKMHMDVEAELSAKLADFERQINESSSLLKRSKERVTELEMRITSLEEELCSSKGAAADNEERFSAELSTVTKLAELYKASSEEWSKKAGELEGVIKALETHMTQVENEYKEKLEKEVSLRKNLEKEAADMKEKLEKCEAEIENARKANESSILPLSSFRAGPTFEELDSTHEDGQLVVPKIPLGISGTALAASLLRDGWSLAKMYEKYQEAADALRHEKWGRKHAEAILEQVLHEIEVKAEIILDERAEHERMVEAYSLMNQKLQQALLEHDNFENTIRNLKSESKKCERDHTIAQKEISDLQKQVTVLLKECQDIQLRCGATPQVPAAESLTMVPVDIDDGIDARNKISESLMTFKDIHGLVEQNVQLRSLVHSLTREDEKRDFDLRESFQLELQKVTDEATAKVEAVLKRSEEQGHMIESLHSSVAMYKRLYEEEHRLRASSHVYTESTPEDGKKELMRLFEGSQDVSKKANEQLTERARNLEEDLAKLRGELISLRSERDKMTLEASFAREKLDSFKTEFEHQRKEANAVSARNVELTHLLVDYQRRLRESSDSLQASEENLRKLSMEVSILKHEKEILINSEKRASDEVRSLSERVHRLQSSLDTIQSTEEVRETARGAERRKHEEYLKQVERDWAEAKKELQEERDHVRALMLDREKAMDNSMKQVDEMRKELADAWRAVASAESRAAVAEARCSDLEAKISCTEKKVIKKNGGNDHSVFYTDEVTGESWKVKEEMEKLKEEAQANKDFMLQYKEIANTNEVALKQIESAHEQYKVEAEKLRKSLEDEVLSLRNKVSELEKNYVLKCEEVGSAMESKERELSSVLAETSGLRDEISRKMTQIEVLEFQISSLKDDLDREHIRWRTAQDNYERQVVLQAEAIQELTNTSKELSSLQSEIAKLREISDAQKAENDYLKALWKNEKSELQSQKCEAERKYNEINEQNKILHNRLESLHIRLAEREQSYAGLSSQNVDSKTESDLQNVISYLRRSKEIAETEISLLKQEKLRLQSQLEGAMKAAERAQALLHSQHENSRSILFKDEEFKSLQLQVREINLLRESNMQLREENKHNFEECQKLRDEVQKAKMEAENFENLLKEKQIEFDACQKEAEMHKMEIGHLNNRILELVESCKNIDPAEHERMKDELQQIKVLLKENEMDVQLTKDLLTEKQETISNLEQALAKCQSELAEQVKRLNDALQIEANIRQENDKQKKILSLLKKKNETLTKEKEELNKENQALLKQIEDLKSSTNALVKQIEDFKSTKKTTADSVDQATKEKDTRIQILEKTLERERDDNKKEKAKRRNKRPGNVERSGEGELVVYRILCPDGVIGSVIGKSGKVINSIRQETYAKIKVVDPFPGADKRVITIYCYVKDKDPMDVDEDSMEPLCPAQYALLKVHDAIVNALANASDSDKRNKEEAHILVPASQVAIIIGKSGATIKRLRSKTKANIKVNPKDANDATHSCAMSHDNFVQITGDAEAVKKALFAISSIMYKFSPKEEISLDTSVPELPPIIIPSDVTIYPAGSFFPAADAIVSPSQSVPSVIGAPPPVSELRGYTDTASAWPVYPSALPVVSGYGGPSRSEDLVVRVLCPSDKIGRVIGKGGSTIKSIRQNSGARIDVDDTKDETEECLITVTSTESTDDIKSASIEAILLLQGRINDEDAEKLNIRLLVPSKVIGCLIGKGGSIISDMRKKTKAEIRISRGEKPKRAASSDELVEVTGEVCNLRDALVQIILRLREDALRDRNGSQNEHKDGTQNAPPVDPLYTSSLSVPPVLPSIPPVAPLSYNQRVETERGFGVLSGSNLYGYGSLQAGENGYGSLSQYSSKSYGGLPPYIEMVIPANALAKVMGKGGTNIENLRKISGARIEIVDSKSSRYERIAQISGTSEQKRAAENLIQAFIMST